MGAEWSEEGGRLARGKILADRQQLKRKKGSWVVLRDLYLAPYLCAGAVGICGSGLLQSQSGKILQVDNTDKRLVIADLTLHVSDGIWRIDANLILMLM